MTTTKAIAKTEQTVSERFTNMVVKEFTGTSGELALTDFQKRLVGAYFRQMDAVLKMAEEKRLRKAEKNRDTLEITWNNVNMPKLAIDVVSSARIGLDPSMPNHINMVPYKNNTTNKFDIGFIPGYRGKELMAMKYGFNVPDDVVVEVVCENDVFKPFKKDKNNEVESYIFEIPNPFDRGEIKGGFYYHRYSERPYKNKVVFMNLSDIEKRKPEYASVEFWGGEKDVWKDGKKAGKEKVEGWYYEMVWKTIYRAAYGAITIDSQKIDDDFIKLTENEEEHEAKLKELNTPEDEALKNANQKTIEIPYEDAQEMKEEKMEEEKLIPESQEEPVEQPKMKF